MEAVKPAATVLGLGIVEQHFIKIEIVGKIGQGGAIGMNF
jgi:hypothetical protein